MERVIEHRQSDITVVEKDQQTVLLTDIDATGDSRADEKEQEKIDKH